MTQTRPELVIFDCDGVLVDTEPTTDRVISASLTRYGWPISPHEVGGLFIGGTITQIYQYGRDRGAALPPGWVEEVYRELYEALEDTRPIEGVVDVLDHLDHCGLPYCIGSNGRHAKMDVSLKSAGLLERFVGRRFTAEDVPNPKPAPDLFLHAAAQMGATPHASVVVGDTSNDARAAQAAGIRCFGYAATTPKERFTEYGATPFASMAELPSLLGL